MTHLRLNFSSPNTFAVALENSQEIIGHVVFVLDEAKDQPLGYRFKPLDGEYGPLCSTIAETLRERYGQVQLTIDAIENA